MAGSGPGSGHDPAPHNHDALNTALGYRNYRSWMGPAAAPVKPPNTTTTTTAAAAPVANTTSAPTTAAPRLASSNRPTTTAPAPRHDHRTDYYNPLNSIHHIDSFIATLPNAPLHGFDFKRLRVLRDALENNDFAYLTMHQYFTLHAYATKYAPATLPQALQQLPDLPVAFDMMCFVLQSNDQLSPQCLRFCATFPHQLAYLHSTWPAAFQHESHAFFTLVKRSVHFHALRTEWESRGFGPLAHELAHELGIISPTFQLLVFTAVSRRINNLDLLDPMHAHFEDLLLKVFRQNQANLANMSAHNPHWHTNHRNRDNELRVWGTRLLSVPSTLGPVFRTRSLSRPAPSPVYAHSTQPATQRARPRGVARSQHSSHSPLPTSPVPSAVKKPRRTPLLPRPGWNLPQQRVPIPVRFGLHQADLRSPVLQAQDATTPLYHCWEDFLLAPKQLLDADRAVETWSFTLPSHLRQNIAAVIPMAPGACETRAVMEQSKTFRLRCVKWTASEPPRNHIWAISDTSWIPYSYFALNGTSLQQRKKKHYGKDRPIEITGFLKEGDNTLEIAVMSQSSDLTYRNYLVAIEVLGIMTHTSIQQRCRNNTHSKEECLTAIKAKLSGAIDGDDDITVVESSLTISLCDPFSGSVISGVPVRSTACLHHDCFDLDTFLQTRARKGDTSVSDQWRCPVCSADARPSLLFVDGFIEDVRTQLETQGLSHTRAIVVDQSGSWKPKAEVRDPNGVQDNSPDAESPAVAQFVPPAHIEIIDLDD